MGVRCLYRALSAVHPAVTGPLDGEKNGLWPQTPQSCAWVAVSPPASTQKYEGGESEVRSLSKENTVLQPAGPPDDALAIVDGQRGDPTSDYLDRQDERRRVCLQRAFIQCERRQGRLPTWLRRTQAQNRKALVCSSLITVINCDK